MTRMDRPANSPAGARGPASRKSLVCDTCGKTVPQLRRDVIEPGYNALSKPPLWNCDECYEAKRRRREADAGR